MDLVVENDVYAHGIGKRNESDERPDEAQVVEAMFWLGAWDKRRSINRKVSSYELKHLLERLARTCRSRCTYISNGALIAAALRKGFSCVPCAEGSPNGYLNLGLGDINKLRNVLFTLQKRWDCVDQ